MDFKFFFQPSHAALNGLKRNLSKCTNPTVSKVVFESLTFQILFDNLDFDFVTGNIKYVSLIILTVQNAALGLSMRYARTRDVEMFSSSAGKIQEIEKNDYS